MIVKMSTISLSSFDMFGQEARLRPFIDYDLLRATPRFALAFVGALLPLRYTEPALEPLFALPRR